MVGFRDDSHFFARQHVLNEIRDIHAVSCKIFDPGFSVAVICRGARSGEKFTSGKT